MNAKINIDIIAKLFSMQSSTKLIIKALEIFKPSKNNCKKQICLYMISLITSFFVGVSLDTISIMVDSTQTILDVMLALFGIVFTGYAFFQALINDELLVRLIKDTVKDESDGKEKCKLQESNESFVQCMMLNILAVLISLLLKIIINSIPSDFLLSDYTWLNNMLSIVVISIYFYFIVTIIWEVKSFIFNIFQLFNAYSGTRVLNLFDDKLEK